MKRIATLIAFCGAWSAVQAAPFDCDGGQKDRAASLADVGLATVSATVHFSIRAEPGSEVRAYVTSGDVVLTGERRAGWVCALYPNKRGGTKGWLPQDRLTAMAVVKEPPLKAWAGKWQMHDDTTIAIKVEGDMLAVSGEAFWYRDSPTGAHIGEIEGKLKPVRGIANLRHGDVEYGCRADLRRVGPYLVVEESGCGGMNVSFTGAYRRQGP